jgi:signal peptidase I
MAVTSHHDTVVDILSKKLSPGDRFRLRVTSISMIPILQPEDFILVESCEKVQIQRGDLISIRRPQDIVTHRLIKKYSGIYITKGDNSPLPDPSIMPQDILGRVIRIERGTSSWNIHQHRWGRFNRFLGLVGWFEVNVFRFASRLIPSIYDPENKFIKEFAHFLVAPFRITNWAIVRFICRH